LTPRPSLPGLSPGWHPRDFPLRRFNPPDRVDSPYGESAPVCRYPLPTRCSWNTPRRFIRARLSGFNPGSGSETDPVRCLHLEPVLDPPLGFNLLRPASPGDDTSFLASPLTDLPDHTSPHTSLATSWLPVELGPSECWSTGTWVYPAPGTGQPSSAGFLRLIHPPLP
jgi:hypothetical protein